jgi:hypothetical protein
MYVFFDSLPLNSISRPNIPYSSALATLVRWPTPEGILISLFDGFGVVTYAWPTVRSRSQPSLFTCFTYYFASTPPTFSLPFPYLLFCFERISILLGLREQKTSLIQPWLITGIKVKSGAQVGTSRDPADKMQEPQVNHQG